jgi:uncharacterized protein (TIGR02996 family)
MSIRGKRIETSMSKSPAPDRFPRHGPVLRALLAACHNEPDDDTHRLVLADWLDDHDDPRGELVRLQCRLAAMPAGDPEYDALFAQHRAWWDRFGTLWEEECGTLMVNPGPHDRGLPTVGQYAGFDAQIRASALGDPKTASLAAVIETGWPGMTWVGVSVEEDDPDDPWAVFTRPPWAGSSTPVGICFLDRITVTANLLDQIAKIPNLRGLSLSDTSAPVKLLPQLATLTQLEHLDLGSLRLTDDGVKTLAPLTRLRTLVSGMDRLTDTGTKALTLFPELRELRLATKQLTAEGFKPLGRLTKLEVLEVLGADDAAVKSLRGLTRLRDLQLSGASVSGRGLEHFPLLTHLDLNYSHVDDTGLSHLAGLTRLRILHLGHTRITGAGLRHLGGLRWLRCLYLFGNKIGDADLVHLEGLTELEHLGLTGARVTEAGTTQLKEKLKKVGFQM